MRHSHNKKSAPSQTVATERIASKICQGQSRTVGSRCSKFNPNRFTFGGVIAERVKAVFLAYRINTRFASNTVEANNEDNQYSRSSSSVH